MGRYHLPGYLQHHTQPCGENKEVRKEKETIGNEKTIPINIKKTLDLK